MQRTAVHASPVSKIKQAFGRHTALPPHLMLGFWVKALAVLLISLFAYQSSQTRSDASRQVRTTLTVISKLQALPSILKDAETGQRGFC
jgi:CHASE3 domain sensor protein